MADKTVRMSDLSNSLADKRVVWSVGRKNYELDMTNAEFDDFQKLLEPFVKASRLIRKPRSSAGKSESE